MQRRSLFAGLGLGLLTQQTWAAAPWRMATGYPADSFQTRNAKWFAEEVSRETSGQLAITVHDNNSLVPLSEISQAVAQRRIELGEVLLSGGLPKEVTVAGADAVPFLTRSAKDVKRLWDCQRPVLERQLAATGLKALYAVPWPPQCLFSTVPISRAQDFQGLRMRTYNATTESIAKSLGAVPVATLMTELRQALSQVRFDTMITSAVTGVDQEVWGRMKHLYLVNAWSPKNIVFMHQATWQSLGATAQAAVTRVAARAEQRGWAASADATSASVEALKARGVTVEIPSAALSTSLRQMGERFSREWVRAAGTDANAIFLPYYAEPNNA